MKNASYSEKIANVIKNFLINDDWYFSFDEKNGVFDFELYIESKIKRLHYMIRVNEDNYIVYAVSPVGVDIKDCDMLLKMTEFICRANYGLCSGNFELDMRDGEIRCKCYVDCDGGITPTEAMVRNSIHCPAVMFDCYAQGIIDIIFGDTTAKAAAEKSEKSMNEELYELLGNEEAYDYESMEAMVSRLAVRMGISYEEPKNAENAVECTDSGNIRKKPFAIGGVN